jgi:hypothetical protein
MPDPSGDPATPWRLVAGRPAPAQLDGVSCGPASLTIARMLRDPALARWVATGDRGGRAFPDVAGGPQRLAAYHALVHRRTTALLGPTSRLQAPWPRSLGTPPWGACRELESITDTAPGGYRSVLVRHTGPARLTQLLTGLSRHLADDRPAVLYVGSARLPRHVTLLVPNGAGDLLLYDPGGGQVETLDAAARAQLAARRRPVGGWRHPWWLIGPITQEGRPASHPRAP